MTFFALAIVAAGAFLGGLASGAAGFALAVVLGSTWIYVLPPPTVLLLGAALGIALNSAAIWRLRGAIDWPRLAPFLVGSVLGVPIGTALLKMLAPDLFRQLLGVLLLAFVALHARKAPPRPLRMAPRTGRWFDGAIGAISGMIGGLTLIHGPLVVIWCALRGWDKRASRLVYQPYVFFTFILVLIATGVQTPAADTPLLLPALVAFPVAFLGFVIGMRLFEICSETTFRYALLTLIGLSGLALILR